MASPRAAVARGWRTWDPEQRKKKQERNRISKRSVDQVREECVRDLESRLRCVIERLGSVETEVARLREPHCTTDLFSLNSQLPLLSPSSELDLAIQSAGVRGVPQCSLPSERGTIDFQWAQYSDTLSCLGIDELDLPIPEPGAVPQFTGFIDESCKDAEFPLPNITEAFPQPCHPSDPDPHEVLSPDGLEITQEFNEIIAMIHTLNGTRRVQKQHDINEDFLIRAVFEGWPSVFRFEYARTCPLWSILCRVDGVLYQNCPVALRLAHLRAIYRMFMFIMFNKPVPKWFTPKARSYQYSPGNVLTTTDFIAQPELREHLGLQKKPLTNDFWNWFSNCATFECPLEPTQMYYQKEGLYQFSKTFTAHFEDLGNWDFHDAMRLRFPTIFGQLSLPRWSFELPRCEEIVDYQKMVPDAENLKLVDCTADFCYELGGQSIIWPSQFSFAAW